MDKHLFWGQIRVDKTKQEQIITSPNFIFGQLCIWIGASNGHIIYDFLKPRRVILSNVRTDSKFACELGQIIYMTSYGLDEWLWAMLEPIPIWRKFTFGQLSSDMGQIMTRYDSP